MPGSFVTTDRFVRTATMVQFGEKPKDVHRGTVKAWQILNASGVPHGKFILLPKTVIFCPT